MKYELTDKCIEFEGTKVYRIRALKTSWNDYKGELGGYVESEDNLSQNGDCWVTGNAIVCKDAYVAGNAFVKDNAIITNDADIHGKTLVGGNSRIENVTIKNGGFDGAHIVSPTDWCYFDNFGSRDSYTTAFRTKDATIRVVCGCFNGTLKEFSEQVKEIHGTNIYAREYEKMIELIKIRLRVE